jgi:hypothetical protein
MKPGVAFAQMLVSIALQRHFGYDQPLGHFVHQNMTVFKSNVGFAVLWDHDRGDRYQAKILAFDSNLIVYSGTKTVKVSIPLGDIDIDVPLPPVLLTGLPPVTYGSSGLVVNTLSSQMQRKHAKAIELARYVQYTMYGAVGDRDKLVAQANMLCAVYCRGGNRTVGKSLKNIYDKRGVFSTKRKSTLGRVDIEQSIPTERDVYLVGESGPRRKVLPAIQITGYSRARVSSTLEALVTALLDDGSTLLQAWELTCLRADTVNVTEYRSFITSCDHEGEERNHHMHVCQGCFTLVICRDAFMHPRNLRVCGSCVSKNLTTEVAGFDASLQSQISGVPSGYRGKLLSALRQETKDLSRRRNIADEQDSQWHNVDGWEDQFLNVRRLDVLQSNKVTRTSPFLASPDAATIFYVKDGKTSYHHRDNVVPTAAWANQASHTHVKGVLQVVSEFLNKPAEEHGELNVRMDHLFAIRQRYPWYRKARLEIKMAPDQFNEARDEWRDGTYRSPPQETVRYNIHFVNLTKPTWDAERMRKLTDDILDMAPASEKWPNVEMPRGIDGAPFPWRSDHMPSDWSWAHLEACMSYHYNLMWYWCNKDFITDETPASLCFELIYQWKVNAGRCAFTGIPLTLYSHHPSEFAIGHKHHKKPMRTAWPNADTMTDVRRQMKAERSNVLFESRFANYMKMDYAEQDYEEMHEELKTRCRVETEWFVRPKGFLPSLKFKRSHQKALEASKRFLADLDDDDLSDVRQVRVEEIYDDYEEDADD